MDERSRLGGALESIDGLVAVARNLLFFALLLLLLVFPNKLNGILTSAGFTRGSILGFEWEKQLEESTRQAETAKREVEQLDGRLRAYSTQLDQLAERSTLPDVKAHARALAGDLRESRAAAQRVGGNLAATLEAQKDIRRKIGAR
jgi:hypothetical protein